MLGKSKKAIVLQSSPYLAWSILFIIVPLFMVLYYGLTDADGNFTLDNIAAIAQPEQARAFGLSLVLALAATAICFLLAYPLAMILARRRTGERGLVTTLFLLPMWMNFLLRTFAWMTILEDGGVLNGILSALGLPTAHIINTSGAIIIGMVYNFLPFMILPLYNSLASIDMNVINAARDLGATAVQTFFRVTLPLTVPGILSGITMVFIPALTTFAISTLLGGSKILLIGNIIEQEFTLTYDWNLGSGLSLVLMVFVIINIVVSGISEHREEAHK
ncbi:MAG: ABC transporter permease [Lachnospiraceae bacterium]|nr:ABC transporter permease [Lachnospiraceae bacterium]MCH4030004.1 ABC transporter permease [Lachnospiraceae bacterium]MCH4070336.1 ABC transporter permease [Lachnospiraceae bacterium]MCH4107848.1 ABC transporter permease [Lachnospiraceae bacterium]MCI1331562.1 ABC transporter permease [Lachnospiraceae bacterium]